MLRVLILVVSVALVALGVAYPEARGLIIDVLPTGERVYSGGLQSSGANDALLLRIGLGSFGVSATAALLATWARGATRALRWIYVANVAFLAFALWLVDLDVPVFHSIRSGDHLLLAGLLLAALPLPFLWRAAGEGQRWAPASGAREARQARAASAGTSRRR